MTSVRIGSGAGFAGDRIEPAMELAERGDLRYLVFECLAERTIALGALNFVLHGALGGGATRSLALDAHGKCLSAALLDMELPDRPSRFPSRRGSSDHSQGSG